MKKFETLTGGEPAKMEYLSNRVRRADLKDEESERRLELPLKRVLVLGDKQSTRSLTFHPYEPYVVAANNNDGVSVFDFEEGVK